MNLNWFTIVGLLVLLGVIILVVCAYYLYRYYMRPLMECCLNIEASNHRSWLKQELRSAAWFAVEQGQKRSWSLTEFLMLAKWLGWIEETQPNRWHTTERGRRRFGKPN